MEIFLNYLQDLSLQASGDFLLTEGAEATKQRLIRRLLTNPGTYIWHPTYGAGLGQFIGRLLSSTEFDELKGIITSQIFEESAIAKTPPPEIDLNQDPTDYSSLFCTIKYYDAITQQPFVLSFQVSN